MSWIEYQDQSIVSSLVSRVGLKCQPPRLVEPNLQMHSKVGNILSKCALPWLRIITWSALMTSSRTGSLSSDKPWIRGGNDASINGIKLPFRVGKNTKNKTRHLQSRCISSLIDDTILLFASTPSHWLKIFQINTIQQKQIQIIRIGLSCNHSFNQPPNKYQ